MGLHRSEEVRRPNDGRAQRTEGLVARREGLGDALKLEAELAVGDALRKDHWVVVAALAGFTAAATAASAPSLGPETSETTRIWCCRISSTERTSAGPPR